MKLVEEGKKCLNHRAQNCSYEVRTHMLLKQTA